ncbi:terpene synthase family protein [Streptomyces graminilatus]|uniref:terpene synthase family protein n=1 Tax=Streptomyces graminilatus TaxID=1464070 RepID=UPI0006E28F85|nr:hypothetical protein [Streptomyces graminilatus]
MDVPKTCVPDIHKIDMPPVYCPIPFQTHPATHTLDLGANEFMRRHGLYPPQEQERISGQRIGALVGYLVPAGPAELLQVAANMSMWVFAVDDLLDEGPVRLDTAGAAAFWARTVRTATAPEPASERDGPYAHALAEILRDFRASCPAYLCERLEATLHAQAVHELWRIAANVRGIPPTLSDALHSRLYIGATPAYVLFPALVGIHGMGPEHFADPRLRALTEMAVMAVTVGHEAFSHGKEAARSSDLHNLIDVLRREHRATIAEAVAETVVVYERVVNRFLDLRERVLHDDPPPVVDTYLTALGAFISGCMRFYQESHRYRYQDGSPESAEMFTPPGFTDQCGPTSHQPVDIDSISWWWRV